MTRIRNRRAFTLIEILVVVFIVSMLAAFVAPRVFKQFGKSQRDIARSKMAIIEGALGRFRLDCGRFPDDAEGLDALLSDPGEFEEEVWDGPYLKKSDLLDPWGTAYEYREEGEVNIGSFDIISFGKDGQSGGEGENEDVYLE